MSASATDCAGFMLRPASEVVSLEPGLYLEVPFAQYLSIPALSNSRLCAFERSPGQAKWQDDAPEDTEAKSAADLGTLVHALALEPDSVTDRYLVMPQLNLLTNSGKEKAAEYKAMAEKAGLIPVDFATMRKASMMTESLMAYPDIRIWLTAENGYSEVTILWRDSGTGMLCKARPDRLVFVAGGVVVLDVKTIADAEKLSRWKIIDLGYDRQRAHYVEAAESIGAGIVWFYFAFVGSSLALKRYPVRYVELDPELIATAYEKQRARLAKYKECLDFNDFTGAETI